MSPQFTYTPAFSSVPTNSFVPVQQMPIMPAMPTTTGLMQTNAQFLPQPILITAPTQAALNPVNPQVATVPPMMPIFPQPGVFLPAPAIQLVQMIPQDGSLTPPFYLSVSNSPCRLPTLVDTSSDSQQQVHLDYSLKPETTPEPSRSRSVSPSRHPVQKPQKPKVYERRFHKSVHANKGVPDYAYIKFLLNKLHGSELQNRLSAITNEFRDVDDATRDMLLEFCASGKAVKYGTVTAAANFQITKQMIGKNGMWLKETTKRQNLLFLWYCEEDNKFHAFGTEAKGTVFAMRNLVSWKMWYEVERNEVEYFVKMREAEDESRNGRLEW